MKNSRLAIILCVGFLLGGMWCYKIGNAETSQVQNTDGGEQEEQTDKQEADYVKWVEFNVTCDAMKKAYQYDLKTYGDDIHIDWVDLRDRLGIPDDRHITSKDVDLYLAMRNNTPAYSSLRPPYYGDEGKKIDPVVIAVVVLVLLIGIFLFLSLLSV